MLHDIEFKLIVEPSLTHSGSLLQKKWKRAALVLEERKLTLSVDRNCFLKKV
jgi:hypothetical protein